MNVKVNEKLKLEIELSRVSLELGIKKFVEIFYGSLG